jgi:histidine triad (HIT) family protein
MSDCIFCRIAEGEIPAEVVWESEEALAFRDINAQAPTHVQVIPRRHVTRIADFDPGSDSGWLSELFRAAVEVARSEGLEDGYRLVMNNGAMAGQSVLHVHLHVLGGRPLGWPPG